MYKKIFVASLLLMLNLVFIGCENKTEAYNVDIFDTHKGLNISKEYLTYIMNGDINSANKLCSEELLKENTNTDEGISKITSFNLDYWVDGRDYTYYLYNVIRASNLEPKSDLESYIIKVEKNKDDYLVTAVKAQAKKELYVKNKALRIVEEDRGGSSLVINIDSLPKDTYISSNKIMLYKDKVPSDKFGKVGLSFSGKKAAITTTNTKDSYICVANLEDSIPTLGNDESSSEGQSSVNQLSDLEEVLEKPIASKIVSIDLLKNSTINKYIFSQKENILVVNYTSDSKKSFNIYNAEEGDLKSKIIAENFDKENFEIEATAIDGDEVNFIVTSKQENDKTGKYVYNLETEEIKKL